jgi:hypothetical protein
MELLSTDCESGFGHETRCREVCSPPAHTGPKNTCLNLCEDLKNRIEIDPNFLSKVITRDESWCNGYDLETKQASSQWKVKYENDAHCFFRCLRNLAPGIHSSWTDCQSGILLGGFEAIERECAKKTPRIVEIGWLVSPSWQHPSSHGFVCDPVFGLCGMDHHFPPTLFTRPSPLWFLFIPDNEKKHWKCSGGGSAATCLLSPRAISRHSWCVRKLDMTSTFW